VGFREGKETEKGGEGRREREREEMKIFGITKIFGSIFVCCAFTKL